MTLAESELCDALSVSGAFAAYGDSDFKLISELGYWMPVSADMTNIIK
jgi:hypothetical protein